MPPESNAERPPDEAIRAAANVAVQAATREFVSRMQTAETDTGGWRDMARTRELVLTAVTGMLDRLDAIGCRGESNRLLSSELWNAASHWLERGALQRRAREKPRGYAGDFEMFLMIAEGQCTDDPLGRIFDEYFQQQAAPRAVRERVTTIADAVVEKFRQHEVTDEFHLVSVGCGPALDVYRAVTKIDADQRLALRVTLLDLDPAAVEFAERKLSPCLASGQLACRRENLFRLARRADRAGVVRADFLCCAGLFDYLGDDDAVAMLDCFWQALTPTGRLFVFNFLPENPSRAYMEWIGNWYLRYRSPAELTELARRAHIPESSFRIEFDSLGVIARLDACRYGQPASKRSD